jgi:cobalt-zinc-cadmium efflux system protein
LADEASRIQSLQPVTEERLNAVFFLTVGYFFVELVGGLHYHSLALVTDAAFMAINVTGQLIALAALRLSEKPADTRHTFGHERVKVLSGLFNGILVGFVVFYVFADAYHKIRQPQPIDADKVLFIAVLGLGVNGFGLTALRPHAKDINVRGAFLLVLNDALGSVGVITSSVVIRYTGLYVVDALTGVLISLLVAYPTYFLVRDTWHILMEGNPSGITVDSVESYIWSRFPHIRQVKDLRIWAITPDKVLLAVRVRTDGEVASRARVRAMKEHLKQQFGLYDVYVEAYEDEA